MQRPKRFKVGQPVNARGIAFTLTVTKVDGENYTCRFGTEGGYAGVFNASQLKREKTHG